MKIQRDHLTNAVQSGVLQPGQDSILWDFLQAQQRGGFSRFLFFLGGGVAIASMSVFMTLSLELFGGYGLALIALCYAVIGLLLAETQLAKQRWLLVSIFSTFSIIQVPLFVFGVLYSGGKLSDNYHDYHQWIDGGWIWLELPTLLAAAFALYRYRTPFLLMPAAVTLWYMSMDVAPLLLQSDDHWNQRLKIAAVWGLCTLALAFYVDVRNKSRQDFAFWLYFAGLLSFCGSFTLIHLDSEWSKAGYAIIHLFLLLTGAALSRKTFITFGAIGLFIYIGDVAFRLFGDSAFFSFALCFVGFMVIGLGIQWQRHEHQIESTLQRLLPPAMQHLRERE